MSNALYSYAFPILWLLKVVLIRYGTNSSSYLKLLLFNILICLIPLTIDSRDYGMRYTKAALIILLVIFSCDYYAYQRPLLYFAFSISYFTIMIISYYMVNSNSDSLDIWHALKNMVLPIILTNSIQFINIGNVRNEYSRGYCLSLFLVVSLVGARIFVLPRIGMEFSGMDPKAFFDRLGVAMGTPLMETLFFTIFCLNVFGFNGIGIILAVVMVIPFVFFHEYFVSFDQTIYFSLWHFILLISYYFSRNEVFVIILHYSVNLIFYIAMMIRWAAISV